jgi:PelA/Pel-15E family pectate lyase
MFRATGEDLFLRAAVEAADALIYGQLKSGGWTNSIDFNPRGKTAAYRNGKGRGKNNSSLDDGQTSSAIRFLIELDEVLQFRNDAIHEATQFALDSLLAAQFPNGAFPQVWTGPVADQPIRAASLPDYDWRTQGRIKNYWDMYTLNDNVCGYVARTLAAAHRVYGEQRYETALRKLGEFLLLAQMPDPQPAWAQQYNYAMRPIWARKFEPPAIAGDESQEAIATLLFIYGETGDRKYLTPIPRAMEYLQASLLPDGQLARFYELQTNRPLYMFRRGDTYTLTYDDSRLPKHYGWKIPSRLGELRPALDAAQRGQVAPPPNRDDLERQVRRIIDSLDEQGRWIDVYDGQRLVGQPKFAIGFRYLSSATFSRNLEILSAILGTTQK